MKDHSPSQRATLAAFAAELGHELVSSLNLFNLATERLANGQPLDAEDITLLQHELQRLGGVTARLRNLASSQAAGARAVFGASELVRLALQGRPEHAAQLALDIAEPARFEGDPQLLALALTELIDNALEARHHAAGLRVSDTGDICVWDDGPGFGVAPSSTASHLAWSAWGTSSKPGRLGLGLTLVARAARAHRLELELHRSPERTEVWLKGAK